MLTFSDAYRWSLRTVNEQSTGAQSKRSCNSYKDLLLISHSSASSRWTQAMYLPSTPIRHTTHCATRLTWNEVSFTLHGPMRPNSTEEKCPSSRDARLVCVKKFR